MITPLFTKNLVFEVDDPHSTETLEINDVLLTIFPLFIVFALLTAAVTVPSEFFGVALQPDTTKMTIKHIVKTRTILFNILITSFLLFRTLSKNFKLNYLFLLLFIITAVITIKMTATIPIKIAIPFANGGFGFSGTAIEAVLLETFELKVPLTLDDTLLVTFEEALLLWATAAEVAMLDGEAALTEKTPKNIDSIVTKTNAITIARLII